LLPEKYQGLCIHSHLNHVIPKYNTNNNLIRKLNDILFVLNANNLIKSDLFNITIIRIKGICIFSTEMTYEYPKLIII